MTRLMLIWFPGRFGEIHQPALRTTISFNDYLRAAVPPPSRQFNVQPVRHTYLKIFVVISFFSFSFSKAPLIYFSNMGCHRDFIKSLIVQGRNLTERKKKKKQYIKYIKEQSGLTLGSRIQNVETSTENLVAV